MKVSILYYQSAEIDSLSFYFSAMTPFDIMPANTTACLGQFALFRCKSTVTMSRFFWFVNGTPTTGLPESYHVLSSSEDEQSSSFRILAFEETNNSVVTCGIDTSNRISDFSIPVFLIGMSI